MTVMIRFVLRNLTQTIFALMLIPATSAWGQVPQTPPDASSGTTTAAAPETTAPANAAPQSVERQEATDVGSGFSFLKVVGGLGLVLSLIAFGTFGIRKLAPQYCTKKAAERSLRLVETLPMGERRSIVVIEIDERRLLIGSTPNQITLLANLGDGSALASADDLRPSVPDSPASAASFRNLYEIEKNGPAAGGKFKIIPPDVRAKMQQLRASLER